MRRSGRTVPDQAYEHFAPFDLTTIDEILDVHDHDPKHMLPILEATQAAFGYLPVAAIKRISERTGAWYAMVYGTATFYGHLRFEPPASEGAGGRGRGAPADGRGLRGRARRVARGAWRRPGRAPEPGEAKARPVTAILPTPKDWPSILLARAGAADPGGPRRGDQGRRVRGPAARDPRARAGGHDRRGRGERAARPRRRRPPHRGEVADGGARRRRGERYVVANGYGADPAAGTDRTLVETDPYAVVEGVAIAAFAIGAEQAFISVRCDGHRGDPAAPGGRRRARPAGTSSARTRSAAGAASRSRSGRCRAPTCSARRRSC